MNYFSLERAVGGLKLAICSTNKQMASERMNEIKSCNNCRTFFIDFGGVGTILRS